MLNSKNLEQRHVNEGFYVDMYLIEILEMKSNTARREDIKHMRYHVFETRDETLMGQKRTLRWS